MAKSLRASSKKSNKAKLRSKVFAGVEDERAERLSAKLLHLVSQAKDEEKKSEGISKDGMLDYALIEWQRADSPQEELHEEAQQEPTPGDERESTITT